MAQWAAREKVMQSNPPIGETNTVSKPKLLSPYRWLTLVTTLFVLLQAVLAGQGWFEDRDFLDIHGRLGDIFFLVVLVQLVMTVLLKIRGSLGRQLLIMNGILLILAFVQLFLGYSAEDTVQNDQAAAWHIPNGLLIFGLAGAIHSLVYRLRKSA